MNNAQLRNTLNNLILQSTNIENTFRAIQNARETKTVYDYSLVGITLLNDLKDEIQSIGKELPVKD